MVSDVSAQLSPIEWDDDSGDSLWNNHANWREPNGNDPVGMLDSRPTTFSGRGSHVFLKSDASPKSISLQTTSDGMEFVDAGGKFVFGGPICNFGCSINAELGMHFFEPTVRTEATTGEGISFSAAKGAMLQFNGDVLLEHDHLYLDASGSIFFTGRMIDLANGASIVKDGGGDLWLTNDNSSIRFGQWELRDGTTRALVSGAFGDGEVVQNGGHIVLSNAVTLDNKFQMQSSPFQGGENSIFVNRGDAALIRGQLTGTGDFVKRGAGTLRLDSATHTLSGLTTIADGTLTVVGKLPGDVEIHADGVLTGEPTISGDVQSAGILAPGYSPGVIDIGGDLVLSPESIVEIEIGGLDPGSEHDVINVSGTTVLAGLFEFPLIDGFVPSPGDSVKFLSSSDFEGNGSSVFPIVPRLPNQLAARLIVDPDSLRLEFDSPKSIQFVDPSPSAVWEVASSWSGDAGPTTTDSIRINNVSAANLQVLSVNQNAFAHSIIVEDPSRRIDLRVNGTNLTALSPAGVTIGQNATLELGTPKAGGTSRIVTPELVAVRDGGRLIGSGEIVGPTGTESGVDPVELNVGQFKTKAILSPGNDANSTGKIHVRGDLTLGPQATTEIQIEAIDEFDQVTLNGLMSLGGRLNVDASEFSRPEIRNGTYTPLRFEIMSSGEWDQTRFDDIETIVGGGATARVVYPDGNSGFAAGGARFENSVFVEIGVMGDMIPDGILDIVDVQAFATALRNPDDYVLSAVALGDMNFDGRFDFDDRSGFKMFVDDFFPHLSAAHVEAALLVPEPVASGAMIFAGLALIFVSARRRPLRRRGP